MSVSIDGSQSYRSGSFEVNNAGSTKSSKLDKSNQVSLLAEIAPEVIAPFTESSKGDIYVPELESGNDSANPAKLSKKLSTVNDMDIWNYSPGGTTNIMVSILMYMLDKMFDAFSKLQEEEFQRNGEMRLTNAEIASWSAEIGMKFALEAYNQSQKAASLEMWSALAGAVTALGGALLSSVSVAKSNSKPINEFENDAAKIELNKPTLDSTSKLLNDPGNKYSNLKEFATPQAKANLSKIEEQNTKYKNFADENKQNLDTAHKELVLGGRPDDGTMGKITEKMPARIKNQVTDPKENTIKDYNVKLAELKQKNQDGIFDKDGTLVAKKNKEFLEISQKNDKAELQDNPLSAATVKKSMMVGDDDTSAKQLKMLQDAGFVDAKGKFNSPVVINKDAAGEIKSINYLYTEDNKNFNIIAVTKGENGRFTAKIDGPITFTKEQPFAQTNLSQQELNTVKADIKNISSNMTLENTQQGKLLTSLDKIRISNPKNFEDTKGKLSIFSKKDNAILIPDDDFATSGKVSAYYSKNGQLEKGETYELKSDADKAQFLKNYDAESGVGLGNVTYVAKNGDKLANILNAKNAEQILPKVSFDQLKASASKTYETMESASLEQKNITLVTDSFADSRPAVMGQNVAGKLRAETDSLKQQRESSSRNWSMAGQTIFGFKDAIMGMVRSFADRANAEAQFTSSEQKIFSDMIASLLQGSKDTVDAVAANLRDILANVAKILDLYAAAAEATKAN